MAIAIYMRAFKNHRGLQCRPTCSPPHGDRWFLQLIVRATSSVGLSLLEALDPDHPSTVVILWGGWQARGGLGEPAGGLQSSTFQSLAPGPRGCSVLRPPVRKE